jgi:hypothetical protein
MFNGYKLNIKSAHWFSQNRNIHAQFLILLQNFFITRELFLQKGICVRDSCCNKNFIIFMLESISEGKNVWLLLLVEIDGIWFMLIMIKYILPSSPPIISWFSTLYIWPHTSLEQRVNLFKSIDVQFYFAFLFVLHTEVKPLPMAFCVWVHSHIKIILKFWNPDIQ